MKLINCFALILLWMTVQALGQNSAAVKIGDKLPTLQYTVINSPAELSPDQENLQSKVIILDFWATWCAPCIKSIPHINKLVEEFAGRDVEFLSLTYEPPAMVKAFLKKHPLQTVVATDTSMNMLRMFDAWAIPLVIIANKNGEMVARIHPDHLTAEVIAGVLEGKVPAVEQTPYNLFEPDGAEDYFRSFLKSD